MSETTHSAGPGDSLARLESWSRGHAALLVVAGAVAALTARLLALAGPALLSFLCLLWRERRRFANTVGFGPANRITLVRLGLVLGLLGARDAFSLRQCALVAGLVLVLDGVDGFVARSSGTASSFGAHFDMETDALFVLTLSFLLWSSGRLGPWILLGGWLRPAYVLWLWALPASGEEPRSRFGRLAFLTFALGLIAPLATPNALADALAAFGTVAVTASFARSGRHWYRARAQLRARDESELNIS